MSQSEKGQRMAREGDTVVVMPSVWPGGYAGFCEHRNRHEPHLVTLATRNGTVIDFEDIDQRDCERHHIAPSGRAIVSAFNQVVFQEDGRGGRPVCVNLNDLVCGVIGRIAAVPD